MRSSAEAQSICFGKLPIAGDFLRGDDVAPEFAELDDWIQHGMYDSQQRMGDAFTDAFDALPPSRFVYTAGKGPAIAGWWISSRDSVGRRYPFLLAARLPKLRPDDLAVLPLALDDYFRAARTLLDSGYEGHGVVSAIEASHALACPIDWRAAEERYGTALRASAPATAWDGHLDAPELLLHDLEQVASQKNPPQYSLRWPTRGHSSDAAFWLSAMARFGHPTPRLLMWNDSGTARVAMCPLQPKLFLGMIFAQREDDDAYDMGRGAIEDSRMQSARSRFADAVQAANQASAIATLPKERR